MPCLSRDGDVFVLNLGGTENRFHPDWLAEVQEYLDVVEDASGPRALVTMAEGRFFSNGLDLDWISKNEKQFTQYVQSVHALFARPLTMGVPSVAALQGHAFGGGAMFALAHDYRVMRADRGYFCLPEVDMKVPFSPGVAALIQSRLSPKTAHAAMTTGRRYGGEDALAAGIVDAVAGLEQVRDTAFEIVRPLAEKAGPTLTTIKEMMYEHALGRLREPVNETNITASALSNS